MRLGVAARSRVQIGSDEHRRDADDRLALARRSVRGSSEHVAPGCVRGAVARATVGRGQVLGLGVDPFAGGLQGYELLPTLGNAAARLLGGAIGPRRYGAEFYFDRVLIQPGQPLVFGRVRDKFFFGLPGNPASTMVTFELFARAAVELLAGQSRSDLAFTLAHLTQDFRHKTGLTRFLPANLCSAETGPLLTPVRWHGSGDVPALTRANAFLVADADRPEWKAGDLMRALPK